MNNTLNQVGFSGRSAVVTGAGGGIGRACAIALAQEGAKVVLAGRTARTLYRTAEQITAFGGLAKVQLCDVTQYAQVERAVSACVQWSGRIDIMLNNAGVIEPLAHLDQSLPELWGKAIDINVKGVYHGMHAAAERMKTQGGGTILNMSSGAANSALVGWSHYCASKAAAKKLTEVGHKELSKHKIRVLGLSPGTVATPMMDKIRAAKINAVSELDRAKLIPASRVGQAIVFLCGPGGDAFVGQDYSIEKAPKPSA